MGFNSTAGAGKTGTLVILKLNLMVNYKLISNEQAKQVI